MDPFGAASFLNEPVFFLMLIFVSMLIFGFMKGALVTTTLLVYTFFVYIAIETSIESLQLLTWIVVPLVTIGSAWRMYTFFFDPGASAGDAP